MYTTVVENWDFAKNFLVTIDGQTSTIEKKISRW